MKSQKPLGEILIEAGLINSTHLKSALAAQTRWGGRLGEHLLKASLITESQLLDALAHQLGVAKINFEKSHVFLEALQTLSRAVCLKHKVVPVAVKNDVGRRKLLLAMADPTNFTAIQEVEFLSGHGVVTALALEKDILRVIDYCYHASGLRESRGLPSDAPQVEIAEHSFIGSDDQAIIITQEGEIKEDDKRGYDRALRALVDLLIEKKVFTGDEFRTRIDRLIEDGKG
jgi:type IV pilus assembly protein PilB